MARPKTEGRMINKDISESDRFASLTPEAAVLFCMIIPHLNSHGKLQGGPGFIKEIVCPKVAYIELVNLPKLLKEINDNTNLKWFEHDKRYWIHSINFLSDHQKLDTKKLGQDLLPTYSGLTPKEVVHEVEVEVEDEGEGISRTSFENSTTTDRAFSLVVASYPDAGKREGLEDGKAREVFEEEITHGEHGAVVISAKNYADHVADPKNRIGPAFVKQLPNFLRDGFWRNYLSVKPLGSGAGPPKINDAWKREAEETAARIVAEQAHGSAKNRPTVTI